MANEAVIIELGFNAGFPVLRTVADGTSISKGTLCKLTDPNTAAAASAIGDVFAGIAAADKVASDGSTTLAFYTEGVFDLTSTVNGAEGAIQAGDMVEISGANLIRRISGANFALNANAFNRIVGIAEETASASEVIRVRLKRF